MWSAVTCSNPGCYGLPKCLTCSCDLNLKCLPEGPVSNFRFLACGSTLKVAGNFGCGIQLAAGGHQGWTLESNSHTDSGHSHCLPGLCICEGTLWRNDAICAFQIRDPLKPWTKINLSAVSVEYFGHSHAKATNTPAHLTWYTGNWARKIWPGARAQSSLSPASWFSLSQLSRWNHQPVDY